MEIMSLAIEPASIETQNFRSSRYKHWVNGFIVDGDYILAKINKRTCIKTTEWVWNEIVPPFDVPVDVKGTPVLVNPDNPFYIWVSKPERYHPCWIKYNGKQCVVTSMITHAIIGYGPVSPQVSNSSLTWSGSSGIKVIPDGWAQIRALMASYFVQMGMSNVDLQVPARAELLNRISNSSYLAQIAHGTPTRIQISDSIGDITPSDIKGVLANRNPYDFSLLISCSVLKVIDGDSWAVAFTKNKANSVIIGGKAVITYDFLTVSIHEWINSFFHNVLNGLSYRDSFEVACTDYPSIGQYMGIFEGGGYVGTTLSIDIDPLDAGKTSPSRGSYAVNYGDTITINQLAYSGYIFDHFVVDGITYNLNSLQIIMDKANRFVCCVFKKQEVLPTVVTIAISPVGGGATTPTQGTYQYTKDVDGFISFTLAAYAATGYVFDHWSFNDDGVESTYSNLSVQHSTRAGIVVVTAYFRLVTQPAPTTIKVTMQVSPSGSGTTSPVAGAHTYNYGETIQITAYPSSGYTFDHWDANGDISYNNPAQLVGLYVDVLVTAYFKQITSPVPGTISLSIRVSPTGGGITSPVVGTYTYVTGNYVTLIALPNTGYVFDYWLAKISGQPDVTSTSSQVLCHLQTDMVVTAYFQQVAAVKYHLYTTIYGQGTISPLSGDYNSGQVVTLQATPSSGWEFVMWSGDVAETSATIDIIMDSDKNVYATFRQKATQTYTLYVSVVGSGRVEPSGGTYSPGIVVPITAYPDTGYKLSSWSGTDDNSKNPTTVTMTSDKNITASFVQEATTPPNIFNQIGPLLILGLMMGMVTSIKIEQ